MSLRSMFPQATDCSDRLQNLGSWLNNAECRLAMHCSTAALQHSLHFQPIKTNALAKTSKIVIGPNQVYNVRSTVCIQDTSSPIQRWYQCCYSRYWNTAALKLTIVTRLCRTCRSVWCNQWAASVLCPLSELGRRGDGDGEVRRLTLFSPN